MKKLAVIDGKSVFYRGYYAMPGLSLRDGTPTGGVYGFATLAIELIKKLEPDYVVVAWDKPKTNIRKRREIYPDYKAGRKPAPPDFYDQIPLLHELLEAFHWPMYECDDYEADDIMGAFALQAEAKGIETMLLTSDLDALQMIGHKTKVYAIKNGLSNIEEFDIPHFEQKYGINVHQFLDLKSLKGDPSDNIPGVPGIGEKTAIQLLQEFKTLDEIYNNLDSIKPSVAAKLKAGKELAYLSKEIGRIWTEAPVKLDWKEADIHHTDLTRVAQILEKFEFHSLSRRLPKHMQAEHASHALAVNNLATANLAIRPWPSQLILDTESVLHIVGEELWLSVNRATIYSAKAGNLDRSVWRALELSRVIAYDVKQLYHQLAENGVEDVHFDDIHDVRQAAFLIDPLRRDRSIDALMGGKLENDTERVAALWQIYDWQNEAFKSLPRVASIAHNFDFPLIHTLYLVEKRGIKIDTKLLAEMSAELGIEHNKLEQEMYTMAGHEFNIASPSQLSEVLFSNLKLPTTGIKKGKTNFSTDQKTLDKLRGVHPIIELIEKTRELAKLKNTYVDTLPNMVDENNRIHTTFNQDVAATGRLSSTDPNLQNIPVRTDLGRRIREAFIPEDGNVLIGADYSQFELRLAAAMAGDAELVEDFNNDIDVHTKTAAQVNGIPMDQVTKAQRRDAKVINFGVLYGMSPHGLSVATGMGLAEAKNYIDHYFEIRSPIRKYIDKTLEKAKVDGYVETYYGRRRPTPDINSSNFIVRESARRQAANMPIQGTEADLMKLAMIKIEDEINGLGVQILQIHDSVLVECAKKHSEKITAILKDVMENIAPDLPVKLKVDISIGANWGDL
jgi:DNA polymerase-1